MRGTRNASRLLVSSLTKRKVHHLGSHVILTMHWIHSLCAPRRLSPHPEPGVRHSPPRPDLSSIFLIPGLPFTLNPERVGESNT